jgi:hypothetical protein
MRFSPGDRVRVKDDWPETRGPVHIRTPWYVRGRQGYVERYLGEYPNPEDLAFGRQAEDRPLYHIRFDQEQLWHERGPGDDVMVELYGHWLERP